MTEPTHTLTRRIAVALVAAVVLLLLPSAASAQIDQLQNVFSVGVNAGMNLNKVSFSPSVRQNSKKDVTAGVSVRYISEKYFGMTCGVLMEVNYSRRGWSEHYDDYPDVSYQRTMNYVEVPFLAHLAFGKKAVQFFLHAGPQVGLLLGDSYTIGGDWSGLSLQQTQHSEEIKKNFDYGIVGGGGLEMNTGIGHFLLEGRYYYALSDFFGNDKKEIFGRSAHSGLAVKLTYLFDLTR